MSLLTRILSAVAEPPETPKEETREARADSVGNPFTRLGVPNLDKSLGGRPLRQIEWRSEEKDHEFMRGSYARAVMTLIPNEATRAGWSVNVPEMGADGINVCHQETQDDRLDIYGTFALAGALARTHGGSLVLMVTRDPADMTEDLDPSAVSELCSLQIYQRQEATVYQYDDDPYSHTFREPLIWQLQPANGSPQLVHRSRLLYFAGDKVGPKMRRDNDGYDASTLERYRNAIADLEAIDRSAAVSASRLELIMIKMQGLAEKKATDKQGIFKAKIHALVNSMSILGAFVLSEKDEVVRLPFNASGFSQLEINARRALASVEQIPQTRLFGDVPGGLNSDGESSRRQMQTITRAYQDTHFLQPLRQLYRVILALKGIDLPFEIEFADLSNPTRAEEATARQSDATTDSAYIDRGVFSPEEIRSARSAQYGIELDEEEQDEDLGIEEDREDSKIPKMPRGVREAYADGIRRHEAGETGDGIEPATIAKARDFATGGQPSAEWARKANRFWGRNARFLDLEPGSAGYASAKLWGGRGGPAYWAKVVRALDADQS